MKRKILGLLLAVFVVLVLPGCPTPVTPVDPENPGTETPSTGTVIDLAAIPGVTAPVAGATPVTTVTETAQYTGTVTWSPAVTDLFISNTIYTATVTLSPKSGYTLTGVASDLFTVAGATSDTNAADSGVVSAVFPSTTANLSAVSDYDGTGVGTLKAVQGGTFNNGSANMTVSSFRMSQYEITRTQFIAIMRNDPSHVAFSSGTSDPVQRINWYHAIAFCNKLSIAEGLSPVYAVTGVDFTALVYASIPTRNNATWNAAKADWSANGYRLPTETEWHFAARGGNSSQDLIYSGSDTIDEVAWYVDNSRSKTHPVGEKTANELGLYDMSGNVSEWGWDWFENHVQQNPLTDYRGAASGAGRIVLGGNWSNSARECSLFPINRVACNLNYIGSDIGFRVIRP